MRVMSDGERRVVIHAKGSYDRLRVEPFVPASPGPGEARVSVEAIGVNYADCLVRMGVYSSAKAYVGWPITPGFEYAGTIAEVGADVDTLAVGDTVFGVMRFGAYASSVTVPARHLFPRPATLTVEAAATLPAVGLTAWYALERLADCRPGDAVLVHSAAGGVGGVLVQLACAARCRVLAVVGAPHKVEVASGHGADEVVCQAERDPFDVARQFAPDGFAAIFDANGPSTLKRSYGALAPRGRLVVYGFHSMLPRRGGRARWWRMIGDYLRIPRFDPMDLTMRNRSVMGFNLSYLFGDDDLLREGVDALLDSIDRGALRPPPIRSFALDHVADAHRELESGQTVGKLVLTP